MFRKYILWRLEGYVKKYFAKYPQTRLVAVVGAAGKTSTKMAVATVLSTKYKVQVEEGNKNELMSVPLGILGIEYPDYSELRKLSTWLRVFKACRHRLRQTEVQVIVQELGTDKPGEIPHFARYLRPDITVISSILPEHMENFADMDAVAREEMAMNAVSRVVLANVDGISERYLTAMRAENVFLYGVETTADYQIKNLGGDPLNGYAVRFEERGKEGAIEATLKLTSDAGLQAAAVGAAVARLLGASTAEVKAGLELLRPIKGRLNLLQGIHDSVVLDDTYNSTPDAAIMALRTLYELPAEQRVAVLGNMNELGGYSEEAHRRVGEYLDGRYMEWVVTVGDMAERWIAPAAKAKGINVRSFSNAIEAGVFVLGVTDTERSSAVLFKGSQNGVFLEEAAKLLVDEVDHGKLVRQSEWWTREKAKFFEGGTK